MSLESIIFIILGSASFIFLGISIIISLLSTRYLVKGELKKYLLFVNIAFFFLIMPYTLWYIQQMASIYAQANFMIQITDWVIAILIIISALVFTASSIQLKRFSKVYGFKTPTSFKNKTPVRKKRG